MPKQFETDQEKSAYYRELQKKSRKTYSGTGGFGAGEAGRQKAREAINKRWAKYRNEKDTAKNKETSDRQNTN